MENSRTVLSSEKDESHEVSLPEKLDSTQTLGNNTSRGESCTQCKDDTSNPTSAHGIKRVKKEDKKSTSGMRGKMDNRKNKKESSLKNPSRKESLPKGTCPDRHNETRRLNEKSTSSSLDKCLSPNDVRTGTVWEKDNTDISFAPGNTNPTQTLVMKNSTCNRIVVRRNMEILCGRSCYSNSKVCERHYPRQKCQFREKRKTGYFECSRKTKNRFCNYHRKKMNQCEGFTIESGFTKKCTRNKMKDSDFCEKHKNQPPNATICGAPRGKTICKVVTSRGSYCREHSGLPGRSTNYGVDKRVTVADNKLWGLFRQYKDTGNEKYLGIMTLHKQSKTHLE
tara:strand:- start:831 stop:1844 length:1014 start_codon:yes stop_codon:yes gene_type:complete